MTACYATIDEALQDLEALIGRFIRLDRTLHLQSAADTRDHQEVVFHLYTRTNRYTVSIEAPGERVANGRLRCQSQSRTPRPGEGHMRGRDLADGPCARETLLRVLGDIVSHELISLADRVHALPLPGVPRETGTSAA